MFGSKCDEAVPAFLTSEDIGKNIQKFRQDLEKNDHKDRLRQELNSIMTNFSLFDDDAKIASSFEQETLGLLRRLKNIASGELQAPFIRECVLAAIQLQPRYRNFNGIFANHE